MADAVCASMIFSRNDATLPDRTLRVSSFKASDFGDFGFGSHLTVSAFGASTFGYSTSDGCSTVETAHEAVGETGFAVDA